MRDMEKHVRILGILYIIFSIIGIGVGILLYSILYASGVFSNDPEAMKILQIIGLALGGLSILVSIPGLIGGIGLLTHQYWAKVLLLIIGILNLLNIPFGTILGIYTIWVLMNNRTDQVFK